MPSYLPHATPDAARARSGEMAAHLGSAAEGSVTRYWYPAIERPAEEDPENPSPLPDGVDVALVVAEADGSLAALIREDQMTEEEVGYLVGLHEAWAPDTDYAVGDLRRHGGRLYECRLVHRSQAHQPPGPDTLALWLPRSAAPVPVWDPVVAGQGGYGLGALVTHPAGGRVWESMMNANVQEPGLNGAWRDQSDPPQWLQPLGSVGLWQVDEVAWHPDPATVWRCTSPNNSFAPGVFGWVRA